MADWLTYDKPDELIRRATGSDKIYKTRYGYIAHAPNVPLTDPSNISPRSICQVYVFDLSNKDERDLYSDILTRVAGNEGVISNERIVYDRRDQTYRVFLRILWEYGLVLPPREVYQES